MRLPISIYPYKNIEDYNLDYLHKKVDELKSIIENFISLNTIKYANPIQWNITKQYGANTVVVDGNDGTAYLSVKPVPTGAALTNTDYWTPIFLLNLISANQNITLRDDGSNVLATFASNQGDWLLWNGILYKVSQHISTNEAYVVGYNLDRFTIEQFIKEYITTLSTTVLNMIGELSDLNTSDKSNIVAAINEVLSSIVNMQPNINVYNVKDHGAKGDGVTDDTDAINNLIDAIPDGSSIYFPNGTYMIREVKDSSISGNGMMTNLLYEASLGVHIKNRSSITIYGSGVDTVLKGIDPVGCLYGNIINVENSNGIIIKNLTIYGNLENHVNVCNTGNLKDEWLYGIHFWKESKNSLVDNVRFEQCHSDGLNLHDDYQRYQRNIHVRDCTFTYCGRNGIQCGKSDLTFISDCTFYKMTGAQTTGCAVDCEAHDYVTSNIYIDNCTWSDTVQGCAFNTIKNAIVSNCYGNNIWNQSRKLYHGVPFDRGFGVIINNVHGLTDVRITEGTHIYNCDITRLTILSNLDGSQSDDEATIESCDVGTLVFYGNFDGNFMITNSKFNLAQIEPGYTVKGLNFISNYIRQAILRMSGNLNMISNVIDDIGNGDYTVRTLGTGTHKFINNIVKLSSGGRTTQRLNFVGDLVEFCHNTIEDNHGSGVSAVITATNIDVVNNYSDSSGCNYWLQLVCSGVLLADGNISKSVNGITISSGTNQAGVVNRNYNI